MNKKHDKLEELSQFTHQLHRVRQESLIASRRGDFRTVARLTCEAARLNRLILSGEGSQSPVLANLGDKLFTSHADEGAERFTAKPEEQLAAA